MDVGGRFRTLLLLLLLLGAAHGARRRTSRNSKKYSHSLSQHPATLMSRERLFEATTVKYVNRSCYTVTTCEETTVSNATSQSDGVAPDARGKLFG